MDATRLIRRLRQHRLWVNAKLIAAAESLVLLVQLVEETKAKIEAFRAFVAMEPCTPRI